MDALNLIIECYKQELATANNQKILLQAQCEIYKQQIKELKEKGCKVEEANK